VDDVEAAFESDRRVRTRWRVGQHFGRRFGAMPRPLQHILPEKDGVWRDAVPRHIPEFERRVRRQLGGKAVVAS